MSLRERLRLAREQHGWTQQEAGDRAGVSANMIYMYEAGQRNPSTLALRGLASLYGRSVEWLLSDDEDSLTEDYENMTDREIVMSEPMVALRAARPDLSDDAMADIANYIKFVHEREERRRRERQGEG